jgi:DNA-binding transcriptional LysR family regulator
MVDLAEMRAYEAVVRERGFTAAARTLGLSKQRVSDLVRSLEDRLGVALLLRTTRSVRPTEAGARYFARCGGVLAQIAEAEREVKSEQSEPVGTLRVTTSVHFGRAYLAPVIRQYLARHSRVEVDLVLLDRVVNLMEEGFDVAIRTGPKDPSFTLRELGTAYAYLVASPSLLRKHGTPRSPEDLERIPCVVHTPDDIWGLADVRVRPKVRLAVNDAELAARAAVDGVGVAEVPAVFCAEHVRAGRLKLLFRGRPSWSDVVFAQYVPRPFVPARVRAFLAVLKEELGPLGPIRSRGPRRTEVSP